jgi:hypothetical protein
MKSTIGIKNSLSIHHCLWIKNCGTGFPAPQFFSWREKTMGYAYE